MSLSLPDWFLQYPKDTAFVVGVSGGRDSVALLYLLLENGYKNLCVAHVNHCLRGAASDGDELFVVELARKFQLPIKVLRVDIHAKSRDEKQSLELAARLARHQHFADCIDSFQAKAVLLAHHQDDHAETILFNLLRGSNGLKGMEALREMIIDARSYTFIRPLLGWRRADINAYLAEKGIDYREDETNAMSCATRNRFRNEALPLLNDIMQRDVIDAIVRSESSVRGSSEALAAMLGSMSLTDPQGRIYLPTFKNLPIAAQNLFLHLYLQEQGIEGLSAAVLNRCLELVTNEAISKTNLPNDRYFRRKEQRLFIE